MTQGQQLRTNLASGKSAAGLIRSQSSTLTGPYLDPNKVHQIRLLISFISDSSHHFVCPLSLRFSSQQAIHHAWDDFHGSYEYFLSRMVHFAFCLSRLPCITSHVHGKRPGGYPFGVFDPLDFLGMNIHIPISYYYLIYACLFFISFFLPLVLFCIFGCVLGM